MTATATKSRAPIDPTTAITEAFRPKREALLAADDVARRLAAGETVAPEKLRSAFMALGLGEEYALAEVERHREILEAHELIAAGEKAKPELAKIEQEEKALFDEWTRAEEAFKRRRLAIRDRRLAAESPVQQAARARQRLRELLPSWAKDRIAEIAQARQALGLQEAEQQVLRLSRRFEPPAPSSSAEADKHLASEHDRCERERADLLERWRAEFARLRARRDELHREEETLRSMYLP
jgi:hypothetical protein